MKASPSGYGGAADHLPEDAAAPKAALIETRAKLSVAEALIAHLQIPEYEQEPTRSPAAIALMRFWLRYADLLQFVRVDVA